MPSRLGRGEVMLEDNQKNELIQRAYQIAMGRIEEQPSKEEIQLLLKFIDKLIPTKTESKVTENKIETIIKQLDDRDRTD